LISEAALDHGHGTCAHRRSARDDRDRKDFGSLDAERIAVPTRCCKIRTTPARGRSSRRRAGWPFRPVW
jgi:hypothetical protein